MDSPVPPKSDRQQPRGREKATSALGHRQRLKNKFRRRGAEALETYELLELLLFYALPRRDTKPLAKALLNHYKNIGSIMHANPAELEKCHGIGPSTIVFLQAVAALLNRSLLEDLHQRPILHNWQKAMTYCQNLLAHQTNEQFRVLYLDHKSNLLEDELHQEGTINYTMVYPREIIRKALNIGASNLILAHNHPSGDPTPSREDITLTKTLLQQAKPLGIDIIDHFIIARDYYASLKGLGYI